MKSEFTRSLEVALTEVSRARAKKWSGFDGQSLEPKLSRLEAILRMELQNSGDGHSSRTELTELTRWVADWIPDLDHPLLDAVSAVQQHARAMTSNEEE